MMGPTTVFFKNPENQSSEMTERIAKVEAQVESIKEDVSELRDDVKELHSRITTGNREIIEKIDSMHSKMDSRIRESAEASTIQHQNIQNETRKDIKFIADRVDVLERWRWMIVGAAIVLGYLISHLEIFAKLFNVK